MPKLEAYSTRDFHERFAEALRVRLYPNTNLHLKQLAAAIQRSEHTISRWWHGESRPLAEDVDRMAIFFAKRGDGNFLRAIFGEAVPEKVISDERLLEYLRSLLAGSPHPEIPHDRGFWITTDGMIAAAPFGHAAYVASALSMTPSGDLVRYATGILGWIAMTIQPDDVVVIHHDGRRLARLAAERACEWLRSRRERTSLVRRAIHIEGQWINAYHDTLELAAHAVEQIAVIVRMPRRKWEVKRLSVDDIRHPRLSELMRLHHQAPDKIIHAAANMGAFTVSGVFAIDGENVVSHHVPTEYSDLDPRLIEGKNVLSRADTDYALMLWSRLINAKREGVTFHELSGSVNDFYLHYLSLAVAEPGPNGRVLSSTVILDKEPLAA